MPAAGIDPGEASEVFALGRQLATLQLAHVGPVGPPGALQAAAWWNVLLRLGVAPPLFVVHDMGRLLSRPEDRRRFTDGLGAGVQPSPRPARPARMDRYEHLLAALARSPSIEALGRTFVRDEVVAVLLARLLGDAWRVFAAGLGRPASPPVPLALASPLFAQDPAALAGTHDPAWAEAFIAPLADRELAITTRLEHIDLGPLRLLGLFPSGTAPPDLADLRQLLAATGVGDVVDFCLQLLPSVLETRRHGAPQPLAIDGYASVERRGPVDSLLPSELAHDAEVFTHRWLSDDLLH